MCFNSFKCDNIPRLWNRIPEYSVNYRIIDFLNNNKINNCFEYIESPTHLKLKCWRENELTNIDIEINKNRFDNKIYLDIQPYESAVV
jgi:hypothetical protein